MRHDRLLRAGVVNSTFHPLPGAGHGGPAFSSTEVRGIIKSFLDKHLKPPAP
jgi:hypothetical protein